MRVRLITVGIRALPPRGCFFVCQATALLSTRMAYMRGIKRECRIRSDIAICDIDNFSSS
jgi:hypothetical protein